MNMLDTVGVPCFSVRCRRKDTVQEHRSIMGRIQYSYMNNVIKSLVGVGPIILDKLADSGETMFETVVMYWVC